MGSLALSSINHFAKNEPPHICCGWLNTLIDGASILLLLFFNLSIRKSEEIFD